MAEAIPKGDVERMADRFRLLGDATRLAILAYLMSGEKSVGEIAQATARTAANVSKHLKLLADGGVLSRRKDGLQVYYRLTGPVWERICRLLSESLRGEASEPEGGSPAG